MNLKNLLNIFQSEINYEKINEYNISKLRNRTKGVQLIDAVYYRFMYSKKNTTKEGITSSINYNNLTNFSRQSFNDKENNIPIQTYLNIFHKIRSYYNSNYNEINNFKLIGIDGTYNNNVNMNEMLNMGFYDISNGIPIDIQSYGRENKNKEIDSAISYINNNMDLFKNNIIVADRAYFSYVFLNFLITNNIKFIVRVKGDADNLCSNILKLGTPKYNIITNIRKNAKVIKYENFLQKTVYASNSKKNSNKYILEIKNDCVIVTNLLDKNIYTDKKILELYRSRWDIEVFFKYVKGNYKFQHIKEKLQMQFKKMYICELIITYIAKIVEQYYIKKHPIKKSAKNTVYKINKSHLVNGIFDSLLYNILNNKLNNTIINQFCKLYIKIVQNKVDRSFPRTSKTPFSKWYIKGYYGHTKYMQLIDAITNNKIGDLNKNLKTIAMKIVSINGINYK